MQKRQELLEKQEEEKLDGDSANAPKDTGGEPEAATAGQVSKASGASSTTARPQKKLTFVEREKAKIHLQIRKARAIARKRIPCQVRILTQVHSSIL